MNNLDAINELTLLIYIFFSWLFIAFSVIIVKQKRVDIKLRRNLAGKHFFLGMGFSFAAGRIATGGAETYMYLVLLACFGFVYFAAKQVIMVYRLNRELKEKDETNLSTNNKN